VSLYFEVTPIGLSSLEGLEYNPERPARHCRICGDSFQPPLARAVEWLTDPEVKWAVEILLKDWADTHNKRHSDAESRKLRASGCFLTPEAAIRLVPLGIYPIQDMVVSEEVAHAAATAPRAPQEDVDG